MVLLALIGCQTAESNKAPVLGDRISFPESHKQLCMISSAQLSPSTAITREGITYIVAVNKADRIIYISPSSPSFRTPEGLSSESTLKQVLAAGGQPVIYETGWAHYSELPSGWCAVFYGLEMEGNKVTALFKEPNPSTRVSRFFKRR